MRIHFTILAGLMLITHASARDIVINEVMSANVSTIADEDGDFPDWIEIYNAGNFPINLTTYGLSDDVSGPFNWVFPSVSLAAGEVLLVFASGKDRTSPFLHTNFKINSDGESLILTSSSGDTVDQIDTEYIPSNISRGRQPDGGSGWYYFAQPTPGASNLTAGYAEIAPPPEFSHPGGFYSGSLELTLDAPSPQATIRYTVDGSPPSDSLYIYTSPIVITSTSVIRARVFQPGLLFSDIITQSYIFHPNNDLPVISLATDPDNLWDEETGIYVFGNDPGEPALYYGANFWEDWERPVHMEFYEPAGDLVFSLDAGVNIYGGYSRTFPQKSLAIFVRDEYGFSEIDYQIFPAKPIDEFQFIVLRNSGHDWWKTMIRDALMTGLVGDTDLDVQAYRPGIMFLNGEYWGIHNLREKINSNYLALNRGVDPDNVDLLEDNAVVIEGDAVHYNALIEFIDSHDMSMMENYEYVKTQMDVHNFIDYEAAEIYFDNTDWPCNNIKYWRPREPDGIWKWILYDTDHGFGLFSSYTHNTLEFATDPNGPNWPNPPWSTFLLRSLLENASFRNDFINHFSDLLNVNFQPVRVVDRIEAMAQVIEPEMLSHQVRWERTLDEWYGNIDELKDFAQNRVDYVRSHIQEEFNLEGTATVNLDIEPYGSGSIQINTKTILEYPWEGVYFMGVPIQLAALPDCGYRFVNWIGATPAASCSVTVELIEDVSVTARFEQYTVDSNAVVITEINYNSAPDFDPEDWLEFYNNSGADVNLSGWVFKDSDDNHAFIFPLNTVLDDGALLALCRDTSAFSALFPEVDHYLGNFDFGLNNAGELIRLFDVHGSIIDSLTYDDDPPWPPEPDGNGPTLELIEPASPNEDPGNWRPSSSPHGSPGDYLEENPVSEFRLMPNFPNPFNATTTICFFLPDDVRISLKVYNISGRRVAVLVDDWCDSGTHEVTFDGSAIASGIYLTHLVAGDFSQTQKMVLMK